MARELGVPGYLEIDLVSHSAEVAAVDWIWTLRATGVPSGSRGCRAGTAAALQRIPRQLPFPLLRLRSGTADPVVDPVGSLSPP